MRTRIFRPPQCSIPARMRKLGVDVEIAIETPEGPELLAYAPEKHAALIAAAPDLLAACEKGSDRAHRAANGGGFAPCTVASLKSALRGIRDILREEIRNARRQGARS